MREAIFLDRDGTLIEEVNYLSKIEDIKFFADVPQTLKKLKNKGYLLIVVTNQSGVAKGYIKESFVKEVFLQMNLFLESYKVQLDDCFYCPHHPAGQTPYNIDCDCRKPKIGMLQKAAETYKINLESSWVVGDKVSDVKMAQKLKSKAGLVLTGYGQSEKLKLTNKTRVKILPKFSTILKEIK